MTPARAEGALRELEAGIPPREIAKTFGVALSTLYAGLEKYRAKQAGLLGVEAKKRKRGRPSRNITTTNNQPLGE